MTVNLLSIEKRAMSALNAGNFDCAITFFRELLKAQPDYEHGLPHYYLAHALEETGDIKAAREEHEKALSFSPDDPIWLGGYASFLYLHGAPNEAIDAYVRLAKAERLLNPKADVSDIAQALAALAEKAGLSKPDILKRL